MIDEIKAISLIDPGHTQPRINHFQAHDREREHFAAPFAPPWQRLIFPSLECSPSESLA